MAKISEFRAAVLLRYSGNLRQLCDILENDGVLNCKFWFKDDPDPPHDRIAMAEAFGFELWLSEASQYPDWDYQLQMQTMEAGVHPDTGDFGDASEWWAQLLSITTKLETQPDH
ncbi:MAG: hypothetical protein AAFN51_06975 [Pseudomonadota bacterium]